MKTLPQGEIGGKCARAVMLRPIRALQAGEEKQKQIKPVDVKVL